MFGSTRRRTLRVGSLAPAAVCITGLSVSPLASAQVDEGDDVTVDLGFDVAVFESVPDGPDEITFRRVDEHASIDGGRPSCIQSPSTDKIALDDSPSTDTWTFTWADTEACTRGSYQLIHGNRDVIVSFAFNERYELVTIITSGCTSNAKCSVRGGIQKISIDVTKK